jgi:hypothetical protein
MEINILPHPISSPARSTTTIEDGDVGQKGNFYSRTRKEHNNPQDQTTDENPPRLEDPSSLIDILV